MKEIDKLIGSSPSVLYLVETIRIYFLASLFITGKLRKGEFDFRDQPVPIVSTIDESVKE